MSLVHAVASGLGTAVAAVVAAVLGLRGLARVRTRRHAPAPATGDAVLRRVVDGLADRRVRRLATVVVDGDRTRSCFAAADWDTRWEIGSVTKALTGLLVADAADRGELTMQTTLAQLDPQHAGHPVGSVTVRELVTHTSGLPPVVLGPLRALAWVVAGRDPYAATTPASVARAARRRRLRRRGRYRYSNLGASVLGDAVAQGAGLDYADLLATRLAEPLGLAATTAHREDGPPLPRGWRRDGRRSAEWRMPGYRPAGGVVSTAADLTVLVRALLDRTAPGLGALEPVDGPGSRQASFWVVDTHAASGRRRIWHNGETGGYASYVALFPDAGGTGPGAGRAVVVLLDLADAALAEQLADRLVRAVVDQES